MTQRELLFPPKFVLLMKLSAATLVNEGHALHSLAHELVPVLVLALANGSNLLLTMLSKDDLIHDMLVCVCTPGRNYSTIISRYSGVVVISQEETPTRNPGMPSWKVPESTVSTGIPPLSYRPFLLVLQSTLCTSCCNAYLKATFTLWLSRLVPKILTLWDGRKR